MRYIFVGAANPETTRVIDAVARVEANFRPFGYIDNDPSKKGTTFFGLPVFGGFDVVAGLLADDIRFVNTITGTTSSRYETSRDLASMGCRFANLVHPSVDLSYTSVGVGVYIQENAVMQAGVQIGDNAALNTSAVVSHETNVGASVFVAPGARIAGCVTVGDGTFIGIGATVLPGLRVGRWATIGAGAVVTADVPDYAVVAGNPARLLKYSAAVHESGMPFLSSEV